MNNELQNEIQNGFDLLEKKLAEKVNVLEKEMNDGFRDLSQQGAGYKSAPGAVVETRSFEQAAEAEIKAAAGDIKNIGRNGELTFKTSGELLIKAAAAAGTIATTSVPQSNFAGAGQPTGVWPFGLSHALTSIGTGSDLNSTLNYLRFSPSLGNGAAAEAAQDTVKAQYDINWVPKSVDSFYVAGYAKVTQSALDSAGFLAQALKNAAVVQINQELDKIIWNGQTTGTNKYEGLKNIAKTVTSTKYVNLPDALEEAREAFLTNGIDADTVVMSYKTYLACKTLQSSISTYLAGDYLQGDFSTSIRGLRVVISPQIADGKALLLASDAHQLGIARHVETAVGYVDQDFIKNNLTIRTEAKFSLASYRDDAAVLVTPKSAA